MGWNKLIWISILLIAAACAPRAVIHLVPGAENAGHTYPVFIGTARTKDDRLLFGSDRSTDLSLIQLEVSVPPTHTTGEVEVPRGEVDPITDFTAVGLNQFPNKKQFQTALRRELRTRPAGQRNVMLFVHGYNNNFADGVFRLTQMVHDFNLADVAVHYSWPSAGNPLGYVYDRDSALFSRDGLEEFLQLVSGTGADSILLVAHSVGGLLAMETLRQMDISSPGSTHRLLSGVVLISPDIDVSLFKQQVSRISRLPEPFAIFASDNDRALSLSARLTGQTDRLGTLTDATELSDLDIVLFDVSEFSDGIDGHFNAATSPELIQILQLLPGVESAFQGDRSGRAGFIPGTILTVRNATQVILRPLTP